MSRLVLVALAVATLATACSSTTTSGAATGMTSVVTEPSEHQDANHTCPSQGCPVPDCGHDHVVHVRPDVDPTGVGTQDVQTDVNAWIQSLVGQGEASGIPTPQNKIAFLVTRNGTDLALLWYISDGNGGWIRDGYTACASALLSQ